MNTTQLEKTIAALITATTEADQLSPLEISQRDRTGLTDILTRLANRVKKITTSERTQ